MTSIWDQIFGTIFTRAMARFLDMGTENGVELIIMMRNREGVMQVVANIEIDAVTDMVAETVYRLAETAKAAAEADRATKQ